MCVCLLPVAAWAAPKEELAKTKAELKTAQANQAVLAAQRSALERDLADLQEKLIKSAAKLDKSTAELNEMQARLKSLEKEQKDKEQAFASQRKKLDGLSRIAIRLSRTPPQAMVLMPSDGKNRIQAAHALVLVTAEIKTQAALIAQQMEVLSALRTKVEADRKKTEKIREDNRAEKKGFEVALKARKQIRDKLASAYAQEENKIAALAKKASSIEELLTNLEKESRESKKAEGGKLSAGSGIFGERGRLRDFKDAKGKIRAPVSGRIASRYGDQGNANDTLKGFKIEAMPGANVIAPFDAEVAYSGTFLAYGKLVILKHRGDYHTLIAGLDKIDVSTGDFLLEGEPIGAMGSGGNQQLYVELRENNQPINPKGWMRGL